MKTWNYKKFRKIKGKPLNLLERPSQNWRKLGKSDELGNAGRQLHP